MTATKLSHRRLGRNGPLVSAIGLGCMGMSHGYGSREGQEQESVRALNRALDLGCTFWDTADFYGDGANERLLAKVLQTRRSEVFLCTKFGIVGLGSDGLIVDARPERVKEAVQASLDRLGVNCIDLYYLHRVDPNVPIEKTVGAMAELVNEGKVKFLGLSECSAETLRKAHAVHPIAAIQMEYSPWTLDIEHNNILSTARELGVAIIPFSPLGKGFLTGQVKRFEDLAEDDIRRWLPRFQGENFAKNLKIVDKVEELANRKGVTPAQLVLAWVLAQGDDFIPIPGTKNTKYVEENVKAATVTLSPQEEKQIRDIIDSIGVAGLRYPEMLMKSVGL
ncbi:aldo/keto reductase [Powellomyces hirtus]|nr:aldo/keto reductase [Powellomyces hirtus]